MSRYAQQPQTPVRQSKPRAIPFTPLTPQTPSSGFKVPQNASPSTLRTPLSSYHNIAFTPPSSLPRAPRTSVPKKSQGLESWRRPLGASESPTRPASSGDLLPSAFISAQRRASLHKQDSPQPESQIKHNIWSDAASESSFSETPQRQRRQNSLSVLSGARATTLSPPSRPPQNQHERRRVSAPQSYPIPPAVPIVSCAACASTATDVMLSCSHAMCSGCFTASLNIVGEKPFSCPACSERIQDFRFTSTSGPKTVSSAVKQPKPVPSTVVESTWDSVSLHDSFEEVSPDQLAVLRLDDVPWDVTPRMLGEWAGVPSQQAHVLLDRDGKTLSHAFIEAHPQAARDILVTCRNKVLGRGKRAGRVTITASSQDELLHQLFPAWTGKFVNSHAVVPITSSQEMPPLNDGILPLSELEILAKRILQPDQRYIKDPSLPYYSLISVLNKFPFDGESSVFWNYGTRDTLYTIAYSGMLRLTSSEPEEWKQVVVRALAATIFRIPIFTREQIQQVHALLEAESTTCGSNSEASTFSSAPISTPPPDFYEDNAYMYNPDLIPASYAWSPFDAIADELGVERHIVQAVCERLANCSLV